MELVGGLIVTVLVVWAFKILAYLFGSGSDNQTKKKNEPKATGCALLVLVFILIIVPLI